MTYPPIPLSVQKGIEQQKSWEGISTPQDMAKYLASVLSVDANRLLQLSEVVYSDVEPTGDDRRKIWIKTDEPVAFGIPTTNGYKKIYQYPNNSPFLWLGGVNAKPSFLIPITPAEATAYSLPIPTPASGAFWVILRQ